MRYFRRARSAEGRSRSVRNCQRADGDGAVRSADQRANVERLDVLAELGGQLGHPRDRRGHRVEIV